MAIDKAIWVFVGIMGQLGLSRRHACTGELIMYKQKCYAKDNLVTQ